MTQGLRNTANEERVQGTGGLNIFVRSWRPAGDVRGVVVIVHGLNAHSGHYAWVAGQTGGCRHPDVAFAVFEEIVHGRA